MKRGMEVRNNVEGKGAEFDGRTRWRERRGKGMWEGGRGGKDERKGKVRKRGRKVGNNAEGNGGELRRTNSRKRGEGTRSGERG